VPRVSVIIPAYNAELYLGETLESVEAQTYSDWEVVIADDASTDGTVETAQSFGGRYAVLRSDVNQGPAVARNRALRKAGGELVVFLDADDFWLPTYLDRLVKRYDEGLASGIRVGIVTSDAKRLGADGYCPQTYFEVYGYPTELTVTRLLQTNPIYVGSLVPHVLIDELGGFCPELFGTEDWDLWLRIVEIGYRVLVIPEPLAVYRDQPTSVSTNLVRMARSSQLTYRRALERGALTTRQRRIARREMRLQRAVEQIGLARTARSQGARASARLARELPLFVRVAAENPTRWPSALRLVSGQFRRAGVT
jgi:glycosyltransferase involved in cell wall biosynthesis